jgi:hypothetical protein
LQVRDLYLQHRCHLFLYSREATSRARELNLCYSRDCAGDPRFCIGEDQVVRLRDFRNLVKMLQSFTLVL